jgi:hypothetical protein
VARSGAARIGSVLLVGGIAAAGGSLLARAGSEAARDDGAFLVDPSRVEVLQRPAWVPGEWVAEIERTLAALGPFSIFDEEAPSLLRSALEGLDWVEVIEEPAREFPRTMRAALRLRRPVARIDAEGPSPLLVDAVGRFLPPSSPDASLLRDLPVLIPGETPFGPIPRVGQIWSDRRVRVGAAAAEETRALEEAAGIEIAAVDVSNAGDPRDPTASEVVLVTPGGARILWGRPAAHASFGEIEPGAKAASLAQVLRSFPRLGGVAEVELRFDEAVATLTGAPESP